MCLWPSSRTRAAVHYLEYGRTRACELSRGSVSHVVPLVMQSSAQQASAADHQDMIVVGTDQHTLPDWPAFTCEQERRGRRPRPRRRRLRRGWPAWRRPGAVSG